VRLFESESKNLLSHYKIPIPGNFLVRSINQVEFNYPAILNVLIPLGGQRRHPPFRRG